MLGAIIGDIVGSRFEFNNTHTTDFELFTEECGYTDDTVCTIAIADSVAKGYGVFIGWEGIAEELQEWCRKYPRPMGGYGWHFQRWIYADPPKPYGSFGNGSAMRVSPCGWYPYHNWALKAARSSAKCTHNHSEGIKGAVSVADAIFRLRNGATKSEIKKIIEQTYHYDLSQSVDYIRAHNRFDETCQVTVPQAIACFLEGRDFEETIRLAISIGGDSDTIGAIAGSLAEAHFGIPQELELKARSYLSEEMLQTLDTFKKNMQEYEELAGLFRYYNGEDESPYTHEVDDNWFWWMEEEYIMSRGKPLTYDNYKAIEGKAFPDISYRILSYMFTRWFKYAYSDKDIPEFYRLMEKYQTAPMRRRAKA